MQPLKTGKDNTYTILRYIQNLRRYPILYHDIDKILIYCPALVLQFAYNLVYLQSFLHPQSHLLSFWCCIYFTSSVSPDHSGRGPSPTVTHPHLLHLAGSLMQNEALTWYQSVKALFAITPISWTHLLNVQA